LAEGYGRKTFPDKTRFYQMALGSLRESQAVLELGDITSPKIKDMADHLGASLYKLTRAAPR
jgi:four helix bundle protein